MITQRIVKHHTTKTNGIDWDDDLHDMGRWGTSSRGVILKVKS